ncbi:MAG: uracil-DNA glycosylase family protein [Pseudomonadota bacterium]
MEIARDIRSCRLCAPRFAETHTAHEPRPVTWFRPGARVLIAGQAPGMRVHNSGKPFTDPSGDRLRAWMGVKDVTFYDQSRIAIVPMAFCFPGYNEKGADLPPPKQCAKTWRTAVLDSLGDVECLLLVGGAAQTWHLGARNVTDTVGAWRDHAPGVFPLPHPSWRNNHWLQKNPWFEAELVPAMRARLKELL